MVLRAGAAAKTGAGATTGEMVLIACAGNDNNINIYTCFCEDLKTELETEGKVLNSNWFRHFTKLYVFFVCKTDWIKISYHITSP